VPSAYVAANMPAKYRFPGGGSLYRFTNYAVPVNPRAPVPESRDQNYSKPPYPAGSFAVPYDNVSPTRQVSTPFDVQRCLKFLGGFDAAPDPDAIPNPDGITASMISDKKRGTSAVLRYMLASSGIPFVIKSGFRDSVVKLECPFVTPFSVAGTVNGVQTGIGSGQARAMFRSIDDDHIITNGADGHSAFNSLDVAGPGGTRAELERLLLFCRQYPDLFSDVKIGPDYLSYDTSKPSFLGDYRMVGWHHQTGKIEFGTQVVRNGLRVEQSPMGNPWRTGTGNFDYANSPFPVPSTGGCAQGDRIHIGSDVNTMRLALRSMLSEQQVAAGTAPDKSIRKPGNSAAKPTPGMTYPPILTTDLPINDFDAAMNNLYSFGGDGTNFTLGVIRTPLGFREADYAGGLCVMFRLKYPSGAHETRDLFNFGFHKPATNVKGYAAGWTVLSAPDAGPTYVGVMGAQRRGEWVYGIAQQSFQGGQRRTQFVDRMNSYKIRERRVHDDATYYEGLGGAASGATTDSFMPAENMDLFVSDHAEPELYYLSEFGAGKTTDVNGLPMAYHWVAEDQRGFGSGSTDPFYPTERFKYEFWHTYQEMDGIGPANTQFPSLVFPWRCGDYLAPEMWFFVPEMSQSSTYTGRLKIYRSVYRPGQWKFERGPVRMTSRWLAGDRRLKINGGTVNAQPGDLVGRFTYMDTAEVRNPTASAYDTTWFQDANLVGVIGPFRGAIWGPERNSANGYDRVFRVVRDPRRKDRLHLAMFQKGNAFPRDNDAPRHWDGVWFAQSQDDGKTWGRTKQMTPFVEDRAHWQAGPSGGAPQLAVTNNGDLIGLARANFKGDDQQALLNINYSGGGIVTDYDRQRVIFREGSGGGV
jgi:hypothetical protein